jgi:hypothetical protein
MIENPEFDPLGVGDANDVIYGTFIGMIYTAITSLGEHTLQGKSASLRHPRSMHHVDFVCAHLVPKDTVDSVLSNFSEHIKKYGRVVSGLVKRLN